MFCLGPFIEKTNSGPSYNSVVPQVADKTRLGAFEGLSDNFKSPSIQGSETKRSDLLKENSVLSDEGSLIYPPSK